MSRDSAQIHQTTERADLIAACRITWAEAMAGMARRQRDHLSMLWSAFIIAEINQKLVEAAGRFADGFALRGYDSVQLAAAGDGLGAVGAGVTGLGSVDEPSTGRAIARTSPAATDTPSRRQRGHASAWRPTGEWACESHWSG